MRVRGGIISSKRGNGAPGRNSDLMSMSVFLISYSKPASSILKDNKILSIGKV